MAKGKNVTDKSNNRVVYSAAKNGGSLKLRKQVFVAICVLVVLVAGAAIFYTKKPSDKTKVNTNILQSSRSLYQGGDSDGAIKKLQAFLQNETYTKEEEASAKSLLADIYTTKKEAAKALAYREEAIALHADYAQLTALAQLYETKGDKAKALDYYKKALSALKSAPDFPSKAFEIRDLEAKIKELSS